MPVDLTRAIANYRRLVEQIKAMFPDQDEADLRDTIEGCSMLDEVIIAVLRDAIEREAHADAIGRLIDTMVARQRRLAEGGQKRRAAALHTMLEVGMSKIAAPDMTVSVRAGKGKTLILDPKAIPDRFVEYERKIHKHDVGDALQQGETVPGATLGNPAPILTIRRT